MEKENMTPRLRFPEFAGDWEDRKFSDFVQRESAFRVSSSEYPSVEYEDVVAEEGRLNKDVRQKETRKTGIVFDGTQVLYGKLRPYLHNWLNPDFTGVAVGDWWVLRPVGVDRNYLYRLIQTRKFDEVANQSSGSKMPRADWKLVSNTEFIIPPSSEEQRQIADVFDNIDNLITLQQRKLGGIKEYKSGMLQKMFPKDGERVPEIRFPGFSGDWEQRKLGDIAGKTYGGGTPKTSVDEYWGGNIPWIQSSNLTEHQLFDAGVQKYITEVGLQKSATQLVPKNSIAVVSHVGVGKLVFMPFEYTTSQDFISLSELTTDPVFTCYAIYKKLQEDVHIVQGSAIKGITKNVLLNKEISVPGKEEQKAIGTTLQKLDNLITLQQRKLDEMKEYKKGLLQQMFV